MKIKKSTIQEINSLHAELETIVRTSIDKAIRIGELLTECKENLIHGEFTGWVGQHCGFSVRTAQNYMKIFHNRETLKEVSSVSKAYQLLQKNETVSFLDDLKADLTNVIAEDIDAVAAFDHKEVANKLPDPDTMDIEQLADYEKQLSIAQNIIAESRIRVQRILGAHIDEVENMTPGDRIKYEWIKAMHSACPGIKILPRKLEFPDSTTKQQWLAIWGLLQSCPYGPIEYKAS